MFPQGLGFVLVFEYMLSDLGEIIANDANAAVSSMSCCATKKRNNDKGMYCDDFESYLGIEYNYYPLISFN